PRPVDAVTADGFPDAAGAVEHEHAAGPGGRGLPIPRRRAADEYPAPDDHQGGRQPDSSRAGSGQAAPDDVGELDTAAARVDFDDCRPGTLEILGVVEVADEHAVSMQPALTAPDDGDAVRIDVPVPRYSRGYEFGAMELPEEGRMVVWRGQRRRRCRESRPDEGGGSDCQGEAASESHGFPPSASGLKPALHDTSDDAARFIHTTQ